MSAKTREEWVAEYQHPDIDLEFFLISAKSCLKADMRMVDEGKPEERAYWQACVEQDLLEISVITEILAQTKSDK